MPQRLTLLLSSPRVTAGILTRDAWHALEQATLVAGRADEPQLDGIRAAGIPVTHLPAQSPPALARTLVAATQRGDVVWVGSADGDPGLADALATEVTRMHGPPDVEALVGSYDAPGSRLLDLVAVMDRLRSPGGCPWDAEQTHASLVPYLIEEAHEAAEALETGKRADMLEELGDVLLQVVFHARVAQEDPDAPFDIDDVAGTLVAKLVRRHPHVFADGQAASAAAVESSWHAIKAQEKTSRGAVSGGPLDGVPTAMPTLARAAKVVGRLDGAGRGALLDDAATGDEPGPRLLALVAALARGGVDPDAALRSVLRVLTERVGHPRTRDERVGHERTDGQRLR